MIEHNSKRPRGFTLLEVVISAAIMGIVTAAAMGLVMTGQKQYTSAQHKVKASSRASGISERLIEEIRHASILAESVDDSDTNANGKIDADWSLTDGSSAETLTFNKALGDGVYSDPITFSFVDGKLWRESGPTGSRQKTILASDVTAVTFTRQGSRVILNVITVSGVAGDGSAGSDRGGEQVSLVREVLLRN